MPALLEYLTITISFLVRNKAGRTIGSPRFCIAFVLFVMDEKHDFPMTAVILERCTDNFKSTFHQCVANTAHLCLNIVIRSCRVVAKGDKLNMHLKIPPNQIVNIMLTQKQENINNNSDVKI